MDNTQKNLSLEEITRLGQKFYLESLKDELERDFMGHYVVIDVEQKQYEVDIDRLTAVEKAQEKYGTKLFYIVQIGMLQQPSMNYVAKKHAWNF